MRIERVSGKEERTILTAMIVDSYVCGNIASKWEGRMFKSKWANIVANFCVLHFKEFNKAPGKTVEQLYDTWSTKQKDKDTVALVEKFLSGLSSEYEQAEEGNSKYLVELAARHFTNIRAEKMANDVLAALEIGDSKLAAATGEQFRPVRMGNDSAFPMLNDKDAVTRSYAEEEDTLFDLPGDLGRFFDCAFQREGFVCFLGPEKRGKTTWLVYVAWMAMCQRRRVAFFSCGDESERNMVRRFGVLASRLPKKPGVYKIPRKIRKKEGKTEVLFEERNYEKGDSARTTYQAFQDTMKEKLKSKKDFFYLSMHAAGTLKISDIENQLKAWERDEWVPDIIVIDYMDILAESGSVKDDGRGRINATWMEFRSLLQRWHILGITATQANAAAGKVDIITRNNFSEDKRKLAHVTCMVGINQSDDDKAMGVMRLNMVVARNFEYHTRQTVSCAGCLAIGNPAIRCVY